MKKILSIIFMAFLIIFFFSNLNVVKSRSIFDAEAVGPNHVWSTPNGKLSEDGIPREKGHWTEHGTVTCGGCDSAPGLCWEVVEDGRYLIIYDLVVSTNPPDPNYEFVPIPE